PPAGALHGGDGRFAPRRQPLPRAALAGRRQRGRSRALSRVRARLHGLSHGDGARRERTHRGLGRGAGGGLAAGSGAAAPGAPPPARLPWAERRRSAPMAAPARAAFPAIDFDHYHRAELPGLLAAGRGALAARAARSLAPLALRIDAGSAYTYRSGS